MAATNQTHEKTSHVQNTEGSLSSDSIQVEGDYGSKADHPFTDETSVNYWRDVYEKAQYEGRHRFDPNLKWTAQEEKKLLRKIDLRIMLWAWIMFLALDFNRKNINRAVTDNMLADLKMNTNHFNYGNTSSLVDSSAKSWDLIATNMQEFGHYYPFTLLWWIPFIIVAWSVVSAAQAAMKSKTAFYLCRALLGLLMGGFIPDVVLYLTYFYKSKELPIRLSWFWTALSTCNIIGSLAAAGLLQMRGVLGWAGWQWLFLIEGLITVIIGILSWGLMPAGPCQTASWFRGKDGWFTPHEESILINRLLRDDPSKGDMHNRQAVGPIRLLKSLADYDLWPLYLLGLLAYIPPQPITTYLSLNLRQLGFSVFQANLLAIPSQFLFAVNLLILSWVSEKVNERSIVSSLSNFWILPWLVALITLKSNASAWTRYAVLTGLLSYPYCHAILVAWNSRNSNTVRTRAVSAALYNMCVQSGNIIGTNIYRDDDKPLYRRGNKILVGICAFNVVLFYLVKAYYIWRNKTREEKWNALSKEEQDEYVLTTKDEGMKRLDFRFVH